MKLYFGRININQDPKDQITKAYYFAQKGTTYFGELNNIEDFSIEPVYVFIIAGSKVQLWKAKNWGENGQNLYFDVVKKEISEVTGSWLTAFRFFYLTLDLIIFTVRRPYKKAFFSIQFDDAFSEEMLLSDEIYQNDNSYRNVKLLKAKPTDISTDIQLYKDGSEWKISDVEFYDDILSNSFRDNFKYLNQGRKRKDNVLKKIKSATLPSSFNTEELSILSLYDAFFCDYKVGETKVADRKFYKYSPGEQGIRWDDDIENGLMSISFNDNDIDLTNVPNRNELNKLFDLPVNSKSNKTWNLMLFKEAKVGDVIFANKGVNTLLGIGIITGEYEFDDQVNDYKHSRDVNWIIDDKWEYKTNEIKGYKTLFRPDTFSPTLPFLEILKLFASSFPQYTDKLKDNNLYFLEPSIETGYKKLNLNQILYGPPGTGKTYKLQNEYFNHFTIKESSLTRESYIENLISELNWWQLLSIVVLDLKRAKVRGINEHELIQIKERLISSKTVVPTIWQQLQSHTVLNCENVKVEKRSEPLYFSKDDSSYWTVDEELLKDSFPTAFDILNEYKSFQPKDYKSIKNYEFVTFHQSFSYEDFIEGIKPNLDEDSEDDDLKYHLEDGIFKRLCKRAENDPKNNYCIFIDEINRGNISAIFGELITLIEDDKRLGAVNELKIQLPYSKKMFGVPKNLYIIGTMNTADRSVEALDTALRRRFSFNEMFPDYSILTGKFVGDISLQKLLERVNDRLEVLLDRDHQIGHAYFLNVIDTSDLVNTFENKIIPLLKEYFYGDFGKIGLVLGKSFVKLAESKNSVFADFEDFDESEKQSLAERARYIIKSSKEWNFNEI